MRRLARLALTLWMAASFSLTGWTLSQNPFAAPVVARTADEARGAFEAAIAHVATPDWIARRLDAALAAKDGDRVALLSEVAADQHIPIAPGQQERIDALAAETSGIVATIAACGQCAIDIASCPSLSMIGTCALPFELSPAGDVAALGRAGASYLRTGEVDEIEIALATLGLGATAATIATAGTSATIKIGATVLRVARKMGALSPGMTAAIVRSSRSADAAEEFSLLLSDFGRLREATSTAEALSLLRLADDPADLARLARVSEAAGKDTRKTFEVLGTVRTFRLLDRVSELALAAIGLLVLVASQIGTLAGILLRWVLQPFADARRPPRDRHGGRGRPVA